MHLLSAAFGRTIIAILAILLTALPQWPLLPSPTRAVDEWLRDRYLNLHADPSPEQRVLVVDIDESSLERYPWPWPRERLATLVESLLADGARGVALDILLEKPADAAGDARLAMLAQHGPLVLAQLLDFHVRYAPLRSGQLYAGLPLSGHANLPVAQGYIGNHGGLAHAAHVGNIGVTLDADGVLRWLPLQAQYQGRRYPTLSRALLACCAATPPDSDQLGMVRIPYSRAWSAYTVAKAAELLDGTLDPALIRGRLVLLGSSSLSLGDRIATPLGGASAGLLVHATMLSSQLDAVAGTAPRPWPGRLMALLFTLSVVLLSSYTVPRLSAALNMGLLAAAALTWAVLAYGLAPRDAQLAPAAPLLSTLFLLATAVPFQWQLAQQRSRQLLGTLRQYVAREVVDELLRGNLNNPLAPRQLQVTTLIADMEGYTTQVEALSMEQAARLTTDFLDCLTRPVLDKHGTLDKYTGDGLVAFWGAPLPNPDHADLALDAAELIVAEVARFSRERQRQGLPPLRVRIGIESGAAMAGDFGTSFRSIYTAVGNSVNTASRLEQAAREFPHDVIVGEGTVARAQRHRFLALGERLLRGKEKPMRLYALELPA